MVCIGLQLTHGFQMIDNNIFDLQAQVLRTFYPRPVSQDVVIVGIDEASTRTFDEPLILWHQHIADFLAAALKAEVSGIGLDVVLPDRSMNRFLPGQDEVLMGAILNARHTVPLEIAITFDEVGAPRPIYPAFMGAAGQAGIGMAIFPRDQDAFVRRFDERLAIDGSEVSTLAGNLARLLGATPEAGYIDYSIGSKFSYVPLHEVLKLAREGNLTELKKAMKGKVVLLGAVITGVDRVAQSVSLASWENDKLGAGVLAQAQALRTLLNGGVLHPVSMPIILILTLGASLFWLVPLRPLFAGVILIAIIAGLFCIALFVQLNGGIFSFAAIAGSLIISINGRQGVDTYRHLSERRRLKLAFSGYVSPAIMREITAGVLTPSSNGTCADVCVLFADIRDYTAISEHMTPEDVINFLNRYYKGVVQAIHDEGGSVISFMGDGIMAVFGAPNKLDNPCIAALNTSRAMLKAVEQLNLMAAASNSPQFNIGIGLNFGTAVMGHVGTSDRHDYSAIGDVTNTASRIEGLTKRFGLSIVCARSVYETAGRPADFHSLGEQGVRGRSPIEVFGINAL
jgi:class 3 adenylate cyclase/CHASE2 domain-containing sensor protein